jgi:hypothetical protein
MNGRCSFRTSGALRQRLLLLAGLTLCLALSGGCGKSPPAVPAEVATSPGTGLPAGADPDSPVPTAPSLTAETTGTEGGPERFDPQIAPVQVYRPNDVRPQHDDAQLAALGVHRFDSRRLRLYTDIEADKARLLPPMVDQLFEALEDYFGALPPARDGADYQMTGYLIRDLALFRETGLVPEDLPTFEHGRHRANEFWLRDQEFDYYRAHLLLHEATHSFMTCMPRSEVVVWYMEGMAENFATHRRGDDGKLQFGIMPTSPEEVAGWGRITLIRQSFAADTLLSIPQMFQLVPGDYFRPLPYAWSWGLSTFLRTHPRYRERFQELGRTGRNPEFFRRFHELFDRDADNLNTEWLLFIVNLQYGYDIVRAAIDFIPGVPLTAELPQRVAQVTSERGWQSTAIELQQGQTYQVTATGQLTLADHPKPWLTEPDGISFDYYDGQPVGRLLGCIRATDPAQTATMLKVLPIGRSRKFVAPVTGTLYLRVNDHWNRLDDNHGAYTVTITRAE